jgi:hypothetical protein
MSEWRHADPRVKALGLWLLGAAPCAIKQA